MFIANARARFGEPGGLVRADDVGLGDLAQVSAVVGAVTTSGWT
ncbi:hypothetical protein [Saccharothrix australiensis]|nr:hypothetical protein [Saccharothrix australiensis]